MLLEHRARSLHAGPRAFVFATRTGTPLGQRNVLRLVETALAFPTTGDRPAANRRLGGIGETPSPIAMRLRQ